MKKILPIGFIVILGLAVVLGAFFLVKSFTKPPQTTNSDQQMTEETALKNYSIEESPFVSLTPRADGHEFHMVITNIPGGIPTLEYELIYKNGDGVTQGVPGTIKLSGEDRIERDLLLGTCSSGKCRYDQGVEQGTLTVRYRDAQGRLVSKFETDFHLQQSVPELSSIDGNFKITLTKSVAEAFYITMKTFGLPTSLQSKASAEPYGVFTSGKNNVSATLILSSGTGNLNGWDGSKWVRLTDNKTSFLGTFVKTSE